MLILERWFPCAVLAVCALAGVACFSSEEESGISAAGTIKDDERAGHGDASPRSERRDDAGDARGEHETKDSDAKYAAEARKKPVADLKPKSEQKYQKPPKNDGPRNEIAVPVLLRGEPVADAEFAGSPAGTGNATALSIANATKPTDEPSSSRGRALNVSASEPANSLHANLTDLSDVSMDENDKEVEGGEYVASHNETASPVVRSTLAPLSTWAPTPTPAPTSSSTPSSASSPAPKATCVEGNRTYASGEKVVRDCEEECICGDNGEIASCRRLCEPPYAKAGSRGPRDPLCEETPVAEQPCCSILLCAEGVPEDSAPEPEETCVLGNGTVVPRGHRIEDGCSRVCICEAGDKLKCEPRCPPNETSAIAGQHDRCVALADPRDSCCTITLCDVTLGDVGHEARQENSSAEPIAEPADAKVLNSTAIKLKLSAKKPQDVTVELSDDNLVWSRRKPDRDGVISNLEPARGYYVRVAEGGRAGPSIRVFLPAEVTKANVSEKTADKNSCIHRGKSYKLGSEWYDECISFCVCAEPGKPECVTIECPTDFGLDVLDPHCLEWETVPADFAPKPPRCCPEEVRCRNNGSCEYEGKRYENWTELPRNATGCENRCYCEMGKVSCEAACPPVPALPPATLRCPPYQAALVRLPGDECCLRWLCSDEAAASQNRLPARPVAGTNATSALTGPLATVDMKVPINESRTAEPSQESEHSNDHHPDSHDDRDDSTLPDGRIHYPMDPGHPVASYTGPYSPDYVRPNVEDLFHLSPHSRPPPKEKSKSKFSSDAKKTVEPSKPSKEQGDRPFPGPLAPDRFSVPLHTAGFEQSRPPTVPSSAIANELPPLKKTGQPNSVLSAADASANPPASIDPAIIRDVFSHPDANSMPHSSPNPNLNPYLNSNLNPNLNPHLNPNLNPYLNPHPNPHPNARPNPIFDPNLYPSLNPGLTPNLHASLNPNANNAIVREPAAKGRETATGGGSKPAVSLQVEGGLEGEVLQHPHLIEGNGPRIYTRTNENGETTYHVHAGDLSDRLNPIEGILAHIAAHDPNPGPFQRYPGQAAVAEHGPPPPNYAKYPPYSPYAGITHPIHDTHAAQTTRPVQPGVEQDLRPGFPLSGGIPGFPPLAVPSDEVTVQVLEALDENTVRLVFTVPQVLVGLHGRVELRYTSDKTNYDPSTWKSQIFAPPNGLIATSQLEFELGDLKPSTEYRVMITVKLKDLSNSPTSKIYSIRTLDKRQEASTLPPRIPIDAELRVTATNSSWVEVAWKKFSEYELEFVDGVQLRYKERDGKVYAATPLIHRAVTNYAIENLKPTTTYEIGIYFIPFAGQASELVSEKTIQVTTSAEPDPYSFDVKVEIRAIKSTDVEVSWSGVPYPEDKYVNIYRAIYQSDSGKEDASTFKIAKRDSPAKTVISDLKPGTRYRLWIEVYLTNGRIKKSNVQDFVTKPGMHLSNSVFQQAGKLASVPLHEGDYYGPLVIVAIVASLAILSTLILLMMLMKRRTSSKADISPRKTTSAYDNPSYKTCEDAARVPNGRNKNAEQNHEMATINVNAKDTA